MRTMKCKSEKLFARLTAASILIFGPVRQLCSGLPANIPVTLKIVQIVSSSSAQFRRKQKAPDSFKNLSPGKYKVEEIAGGWISRY